MVAVALTEPQGKPPRAKPLRLPDPPTAIVCGNDVVAFGALDAALSLAVRVPHDVSILGFDDIPMAAWEVFQLSTLRQPIGDMARAAARMLAERMVVLGHVETVSHETVRTTLQQTNSNRI